MCYTAVDRQVRDAGFLFAEAYTPSQPNTVADRTPAISESPCVGLAVSVGIRGNGGSVMVTLTCPICGKHYSTWPKRATQRRYCSRGCRNKGQALSKYANVESRFWAKVDKTDTCWLWTGQKPDDRYGGFKLSNGVQMRAHRFAWEITYGAIPAGMFVCHHCDNPLCVRPDHLFLGTPADNMRDKALKHRAARRPGNANPSAKLTDADVLAIRHRRAEGELVKTLATEYGLSLSSIGKVIHRISWKHLP